MNNRLVATLAALAIAAPLMGCAGETDAPEQEDGVKQDAVQSNEDKAAAEKRAEEQKLEEQRISSENQCSGNAGEVNTNPCCGGYCWPY